MLQDIARLIRICDFKNVEVEQAEIEEMKINLDSAYESWNVIENDVNNNKL